MSRGFFFSPLPRSPSNSTDFNASASECASVRLRLRSFKEFSPSPIPQVWLEKEGPWRGQRWVSEGTPLPPELRLDPSTEAWQLLQAHRPPPRNPLAS